MSVGFQERPISSARTSIEAVFRQSGGGCLAWLIEVSINRNGAVDCCCVGSEGERDECVVVWSAMESLEEESGFGGLVCRSVIGWQIELVTFCAFSTGVYYA